MQSFPKVYHLKMMFEENFLRTVTLRFQENEHFNKVNIIILFLSQQVIKAWLSQNKFTFHQHF